MIKAENADRSNFRMIDPRAEYSIILYHGGLKVSSQRTCPRQKSRGESSYCLVFKGGRPFRAEDSGKGTLHLRRRSVTPFGLLQDEKPPASAACDGPQQARQAPPASAQASRWRNGWTTHR